MKTKNFFIGFVSAFMTACTCDDVPLLHENIPAVDLFYVVNAPSDEIYIEFNKPLFTGSVAKGKTILVFVNGQQIFNYNLSFPDNNMSIQMSLCQICIENTGSVNECKVQVRLLSGLNENDPSVYTIIQNKVRILDGDHDGNDGGIFIQNYTPPICIP